MKGQVYQIKISLHVSKPKIWRRVLINPTINLDDFHQIIQTVMGWTNSHLHQFEDGLDIYCPKEFEIEDSRDSHKVKVNSILRMEAEKIKYEYDFGDGWMHEVLLEKVFPLDFPSQIPCCVTGRGNCPPEDCGGIWGFEGIKAILSNPKHDQYDETLEWVGGPFDPSYFNKDEINERLKSPGYGCLPFVY